VLLDRGRRTCPAIMMMQQVSLKDSGFVHVDISWDSSVSIVIGLQAGWLENHGWIDSGATVSVVATMCYPVRKPTHCTIYWVLGQN
jgi:hypothetical protein